MTSCNGCISIIGAQYDARFTFPSKMVLINGRPKASVLCEAQNVAATASPGVLFKSSFDLKSENSTINEPICNSGNSIKRDIAWLKSKPSPLVNASQKAFQTIPRSTTLMREHECILQSLKKRQHEFN